MVGWCSAQIIHSDANRTAVCMKATSDQHDQEIERALRLISTIESKVPAEYRVTLFTALLGSGLDTGGEGDERGRQDSAAESQSAAAWVGIDLGA